MSPLRATQRRVRTQAKVRSAEAIVSAANRVRAAAWIANAGRRWSAEAEEASLVALLDEIEAATEARVRSEFSGGIVLRGWTCKECRSFNGSEKEELTECRSCGAARRRAT